MNQALVIFGSTTGNTENAAEAIARVLSENRVVTALKDVRQTDIDDLKQPGDLLVLGCSTWGDDEIELQDDFAEFYESMDRLDLAGRKAAVFGCGDSSYPHFCGAVDKLEEKVTQLGAVLAAAGLKIDGDPLDQEDAIIDWALDLAESAS